MIHKIALFIFPIILYAKIYNCSFGGPPGDLHSVHHRQLETQPSVLRRLQPEQAVKTPILHFMHRLGHRKTRRKLRQQAPAGTSPPPAPHLKSEEGRHRLRQFPRPRRLSLSWV